MTQQAKVELQNGETVIVTPINHVGLRILEGAAAEAYPAPDPDAYRYPIPDSIGNQRTDAKDDPAYMALLRKAVTNRHQRLIGLLFDTCIELPDPSVLDRMAGYLSGMQKLTDGQPVGAALVSAKATLLITKWLHDDAEVQRVLNIIRGATLLEGVEILEGYAYFPRLAMGGDDGNGSPAIEAGEDPQPTDTVAG